MLNEEKFADDQVLREKQEEIAEEFGIFRPMMERDFYTFHSFQKEKKEKRKQECDQRK